jgi:hypothetical protein
MVSGYNTRKITDKVVSRFLLIALGTALTVGINICIYPIWSGEDLHNSVAKNFAGVAKSLEGITISFTSKRYKILVMVSLECHG